MHKHLHIEIGKTDGLKTASFPRMMVHLKVHLVQRMFYINIELNKQL